MHQHSSAAVAAPVRSDSRIITAEVEPFRSKFTKRHFPFSHNLAGHPLFELPRLLDLARQLARVPGSIYFNAGKINVAQRFDQSSAAQLSVEEAMARIEETDSWVVLKHSEQDPEYRALLDQCIEEVEALSGRTLRGAIREPDAIIIVTSPKRVTQYHIDSECNFLFQIRGSKDFSVFNQDDREVLPEVELERFFSGDHNGAIYKDQLQSRSKTYRMTPGVAVHIPMTAPHWAKNDDNVSVSLSINFELPEQDRLANIYRFNHLLRKRGTRPLAPGISPLKDTAKRYAWRGIDTISRLRSRAQQPA